MNNINKEQDKTEKIEEVNNKDDKKEMEKEKKDDINGKLIYDGKYLNGEKVKKKEKK